MFNLDVYNLPYDPFNRPLIENHICRLFAILRGVETVTIFNVLNVIKEEENQLEVLKLAKEAVKDNGVVYIMNNYYVKKFKGGRAGRNDSWQHHKPPKEYITLIKKVFDNVQMNKNLFICKK